MVRGMAICAIALACAAPRPPPRGPVAFERHPLYVALFPFGAGQLENGERDKAIAFAASEGATAAISVGAWLYLRDRYPDNRVPADDAARARGVELVEVGTGFAFFGLAAWGIADAIARREPWVEVPAITLVPGGGAFAITGRW